MYKFVNIMLAGIVLSILSGHSVFAQSPSNGGMAQDSSKTIVLYFRFDRSLLEKDYMTNKQELEKLRSIISVPDVVQNLDSIVVKAAASPDGAPARNQQLSAERAAAVKSYLMWQYPFLDRNRILTYAIGENWGGLKEMVEQDPNVPYRNEVISIIDGNDTPLVKNNRLRQLGNGEAFAYITRNMLRFLRSGTTRISFYPHSKDTEKPVENEQTTSQETEVTIVSVVTDSIIAQPQDMGEEETPSFVYKRPIAFKTNLLFDAATLLNAEIEIPLCQRFSIAGEVLFPSLLWTNSSENHLKILSGTLEGRYWLKPDYRRQDVSLKKHNPLTGWFLGAYGSIGEYDLEWKRSGYQSDFYFSAGLSMGYVLPLGRNLNMEFSLSAGYLQTDYWHYEACQTTDGEWHLIKQYPGTFRWVGPTRLKISLVWYPHFRITGKGGSAK